MLDGAPASGPASARIFSSLSRERVRRPAGDVFEVEAVDLQPRLGREKLLDVDLAGKRSISGSMYDACAPKAAAS